MTAPTVVLVHGTWHGAWCWSAVRTRLDRRVDELVMPDRPWLLRPLDAATLGITDPVDADHANRRLTPTPLRTHTDVLRLRGAPWAGPRFSVRAADNGRLFEKTAQLAAADGWTV